jgi:hypothetical protein
VGGAVRIIFLQQPEPHKVLNSFLNLALQTMRYETERAEVGTEANDFTSLKTEAHQNKAHPLDKNQVIWISY